MVSDNIYVFPNTCDNIFVINPNKVINQYGGADDRYIKQENLIYYANLECELEPRSRLLTGTDKNTVQTISLATMNFLNPKGTGEFTTEWTTIQDTTVNQNQIANQLLGIKTISYRVGMSYIPTVTITLEDVKGRALFESGENSPYSAFFNLPYPTFYLTLKGYYGKAVRYPLILQKFTSSFNSSNGNFDITLTMIGYKFNVLTDITMAELFAVPQMYVKRTPTPQNQNTGNQTSTTTQSITQIGYETIRQVYQDYKKLGLIEKDFPELTVQQLSTKLDNFITYSLTQFGQANLRPLNDIDTYSKDLNNYRGQIYSFTTSFFNQQLDQDNYYITKPIENIRYKIYTWKVLNFPTSVKVKQQTIDSEFSKLNSIIVQNNLNLSSNQTFGEGDYKIENPIITDSVVIDFEPAFELIDFDETAKSRNNSGYTDSFQATSVKDKLLTNSKDSGGKPILFLFDGPNRFLNQTYLLNSILNEKKITIEEKLTNELSNFVKDKSGLGFLPSVKNVIAVLMASAEAFLRLLQTVHEKGWEARNSQIKKLANNDGSGVNSPVYPWPQYVVGKNVDGQTKYEIQYPGDPSQVTITHGNNYTIWPEVEFVEEFLKGYLQREVPPVPPSDNNSGVNRVLISAFDTLSSNTPYAIKEDVLFLYEIWERIQTISSNNLFQRNNTEQTNQNVINYLSDIESTNVFNSLVSGNKQNAPNLIYRFKTTNYTQQTFYEELQTAKVNFTKYSQGLFVTQYLEDKINLNQNQIYLRDLDVIQIKSEKEQNFINYIKSNVHNDINFVDTYPFTYENWNYSNLAHGNVFTAFVDINKTQSSLFYNNQIKKVSNFEDASVFGNNGNKKTLRPVVTYKWLTNKIELPSDLQNFYKDRDILKFVTTEGNLNYTNSLLSNKQSTSILNTPFFVNAIQEGISGYTNGVDYPYVSASYYLLNSLPLSTLRERYLSLENNSDVESDFIFAGLKKFGAVHRLPKYWILKIGSIWNRYKTFVKSEIDVLDTSWNDFDYLNNFDPINNNSATTYVLTSTTFNQVSFVLESDQTSAQNINVGFYPKLINDFYRIYNSEYIYEPTVTTSIEIQTAFQLAIDEGRVILLNGNDTNISSTNLNLKTWTVCIKAENQDFYYVCPSFGSVINQTKKECFNNSNNIVTPLIGNKSVHNGAIRLFWAAPNYGYFNSTDLVKPSTIQYFKKVNTEQKQQTSFELLNENQYSSIEEIFSVFDHDELDIFEKEFLSFCVPTSSDNFQELLKSLMKTDDSGLKNLTNGNYNNLIKSISLNQQNNFKSTINSRMSFDFIYKKSNPSGFDKNLFNILSSNPSPEIINRYQIVQYDSTPNSVPSINGLTYLESKTNFPQEWEAMELYIGFSSIDRLRYDVPSNYLTNFFPIFNIGFTVDNIILFRNLIKIYAANALRGASPVEFKNRLNNFISTYSDLSGKTFTNFITLLQKKLGVNEPNQETIDSVLEGFQSKVELYDMFKAINDKWIAGNDYKKTDENSEAPLFRDYLFLDRGSRNVGDIYADITKVNSYLKGADKKSNVFTVIGSIIKDHNFVSFLIPAYINFYGRQTPSGEKDLLPNNPAPDEFANNLFGTFDTVDYQSSKPKMLNIYVDKPSQQLDNKTKSNGYKDDGLDISICAENPLAISSEQKRNYSLENKVVGFAVDFELQNQGVFKKISVSQDLGKATSESLMAEYNIGQSSSGTKTSTQSVSLYNIYKTRSYNASVESMGNAMIQPSMYFVLRNIPLFAGSYFITEVQHTIGLDDFSTSFTGTRQAAPTLPKVDALFQTVKQQLLTNLGNTYKNQGSTKFGTTGNISQIKNSITNSIISPKVLDASVECVKSDAYINYVKLSATSLTEVSAVNEANFIKRNLLTSEKIKLCIFTSIWIDSGIEKNIPNLSYYGNNLAGVTLNYDYPGNLKLFFLTEQNKNYYQCLTNSNQFTQSYAVFATNLQHHSFMIAAYTDYFDKVTNIDNADAFAFEFSRIWIEYFPYDKTIDTPMIYDNYRQNNINEYQSLINKIKRAFEIYRGTPA